MMKNVTKFCAAVCLFGASAVLASQPTLAQDAGATGYTYVSQWSVPRAQWAAFEKQDAATESKMKQAVADGLLVVWGTAVRRVHSTDGYTHAEWFTATSRENLLKVLEDQWTTATNSNYVSATKHEDLLLHTLAHGGKSGASGTGYLRVASYQAKPGSDQALAELLMSKVKAFLDSEVGKGNLTQYNIDEEDIHTDAPGGYDLAMLFPDGAAIDRFYEDYATVGKSDPAIGQSFDNMTDAQMHRDDFFRVTAYQNK